MQITSFLRLTSLTSLTTTRLLSTHCSGLVPEVFTIFTSFKGQAYKPSSEGHLFYWGSFVVLLRSVTAVYNQRRLHLTDWDYIHGEPRVKTRLSSSLAHKYGTGAVIWDHSLDNNQNHFTERSHHHHHCADDCLRWEESLNYHHWLSLAHRQNI